MRDAASGEAGPRKDWPDATRLQVPGVPFFVFNDRFPVSGAHPPQTLLERMTARHERPSDGLVVANGMSALSCMRPRASGATGEAACLTGMVGELVRCLFQGRSRHE
jgi:hypothetical protein